jgi:LmbE family N-acetylglucosaminyl deacetylase
MAAIKLESHAVLNHHRMINGDDTAESVWQTWLRLGAVSTVAMHECLSSKSRLVVIAPHPDDEVLACGGLMAMHHAQGGEIAVIAVTDGEASHGNLLLPHRQALAEKRCAESKAGLLQLGLKDITITRLAVPDGLVSHHMLRLARRLQLLLQPTDVVVSTWRRDGHPDHDATGLAASLACAAVSCKFLEAPVWMWHWASPGDSFVPWHRLQRLPLTPAACDRKQAALRAHTSQLDSAQHACGPVLGADIVARAHRSEEYFFS